MHFLLDSLRSCFAIEMSAYPAWDYETHEYNEEGPFAQIWHKNQEKHKPGDEY
jgi:hypothetical protein